MLTKNCYIKKCSSFCEHKIYCTIFALKQNVIMEITFEQDYLREMYHDGKTTDKKYRFQPEIIRKYKRVVQLMRLVESIPELARYNSLRYEKLKGDKAGLSSLRVNDQYRIEFEEKTVGEQTIATICNITELSNHYK